MTETVVDEEAWLLASPQKPRRRGARVVVASVLAVSVLALAAVRDAGDASTTPDDNGGANGGDGVLPEDNDDGASQPGASGATSGGVAPTVKGPGYGQTMPGHNVDGGFRPVLNAGPDLSEVTQPGLGQGNTFVTSWDDMRKK